VIGNILFSYPASTVMLSLNGYDCRMIPYSPDEAGIDANGKVAEGSRAQAVQGPELPR